jgi:phosphotransferase system HPr (HPr) family protein
MEARRTVVVSDPMGLHARPAARVAQAASPRPCRVTLTYEGASADAKSIVQLLGLFVPGGAQVEIVATGDDADACLDAVVRAMEGRPGGG